VKGNPGSGKSVLMKHAVTMMRQVHPEELTVSYFINAQGSELQRSPLGVIRALLNKILSDFPSTLALLTREFEDRNQRSTSGCTWGCKELQETLIRAIQHEDQQPRPVVMFVDALDELGEDDGSDLLEYFRDLMEIAEKQRAQLKICISSRHYPIIGHENISCVYVEEENREDIQCFVRKALKGIKLGSGRHRAEQDILSKAQGVFQWVSLIIRELHRKSRVGIRADSLFKELTACPPTLSDLYGALLETISGAEKHQMIRLFHWVLFAKRALNAHELRDALAVSADVSCTTMSRLRTHEGWSDSLTNFESYVKHISKGLVEFRDLQPAAPDRGRTAQFIHQTVADFLFDSWLEDKSYDQTEAAHIELSRSCLRYLTLEEILSSPFPMEDDLASRYPLASYATNNLFDHLKSSPWSLTKQCCRSSTCLALHWTPLASTSLALSTLWRMLALRTIHEHVHWPFHGAAGFHALAALGSRSSLVAVEDFCSPIHGKVDRAAFRTLYHANNYSHQELISILLDGHAELYSNTGSRPHQIRSHLISCQDHALTAVASTVKAEAMIFLSLLEADLEIGGMSRDIMLLYFAINSRSTVIFETMMTRDTCLDGAIYFALTTCTPDKDTVLESMLTKLLLAGANTSRSWKYQPNASIKAEDNTDEALQIAFKNGFAHVFNLLIELGSSREPLHIFGPSPLVAAVAMGHAGIARAILHYEPSAVELRDDRGVAALDLAFLKDRLDLAEMLLESGQFSKDSSTSSGFFFKLFSSDRVDVLDVYTGDRQSTLTLSTAERGSSNIYKFKFDADHIDVHAKDEHGQSLLWYAARGGWAAMVRLLLDTNEVNIRDRQRNTPLLIAVHNGHFPIVKLLLSVDGVDVNAKGLVKCTSLMLAVQKGLTEVVTLLLTARGVDVNTTDRFGCPLLLVAAESGHFDVVKILLATPTINIHAMDNEGSSALHYAVRGGYILIVKLLLDTGGFQNERVSLLWAAVEARKPELVLTLIGTDCGLVKVRNQHGRSLLWQVTASGDCKTLQALLALPGIDLEEKDEVGRSLLWQAAQTKNTAVIKLLLETGEFHVECTDEEVGDSALSCVRSEGDDALIALLLDFHRAMIDNGGRGGHTPQCQAKGHSRLVQSV
jgi:ankyrin repeat protein